MVTASRKKVRALRERKSGSIGSPGHRTDRPDASTSLYTVASPSQRAKRTIADYANHAEYAANADPIHLIFSPAPLLEPAIGRPST